MMLMPSFFLAGMPPGSLSVVVPSPPLRAGAARPMSERPAASSSSAGGGGGEGGAVVDDIVVVVRQGGDDRPPAVATPTRR